jgi:uncharacterized cupin superfamily protein
MAERNILWRSDEITQRQRDFTQRLNPNSLFSGASLSRLAGMQRAQVSIARIAPGKDSFAYHGNLLEEVDLHLPARHPNRRRSTASSR